MNTVLSHLESQESKIQPHNFRSQNAVLFLAVIMAVQMTSFVIILPLFARRFNELGAGVEALSMSEMAFALTSAIAAPVMGTLADRYGRRPIVLISLAAYAAAFCGYLLAQSVTTIILIRGLAGAFTAGLAPAVIGLAAEIAPSDRKGQWIGFINGGASFGWIAGPIAGGVLFDRWGFGAALGVSIGMAFCALLTAFFTIPKSHPQGGPFKRTSKEATGSPSNKATLLNLHSARQGSLSTFIVLLFIFFTVLFAWAFVEPRLMFYAYNELGWSSSGLGLVMSTYGIAMLIGELALGGLSDRLGRKPVILLGLVLFSAQFIGMAFFRNFILIAVSFFIAGFGNALYDPALNAAMLDISFRENSSRMIGIKSAAGSAGAILGPMLLALLNSTVEAHTIFLLAIGMVVCAALAGSLIRTPKIPAMQSFIPPVEVGEHP